MQRPKKIRFVSATVEFDGHLEGLLAALKSQTTFSAPIINHYHGLREGLESRTSFAPANNYCRSFREGLKTLTSSTPTNNYCCSLRERLKIQTSPVPINNQTCGLKKGLEIQLISTTSISFVSSSDILKDTL